MLNSITIKLRQPQIRLFDSWAERANLLWPLAMGLILLMTRAIWGMPNGSTSDEMLFLSGVFLLNVTHNVFSFFILFSFPEAKAWALNLDKRERLRLLIVFLFLIILLTSVFTYHVGWRNSEPHRDYRLFFLLVLSFFAHVHHVIKQIGGLSLIYNRTAERQMVLSPVEKKIFATAEKRERFFFKTLIWALAAGLCIKTFKINDYHMVAAAMSTCIVGAILINSLSYPTALFSNKTFYLMRLMVFPLAFFLPWVAFIIPCFHGIEFTLLFRKMWLRSRLRQSCRRILWTTFVPVSILISTISVARPRRGFGEDLIEAFPDQETLILILAVISLTINFLHFYLDSRLFRMKDKNLREHLGPLII